LLVEPPARQPEFVGDRVGIVQHNAVRLEHCVNSRVARRASYARAIAAPPKT
jgi:hypothetical protein